MRLPALGQTEAPAPGPRARRFRYEGFEVDEASRHVRFSYLLDDHPFTEVVAVPGAGTWGAPAVEEAARLLFLLAGVSYYKAGAPPLVDLGATALREGESGFLDAYYTAGLGEFGYRNGLDLQIELTGGRPAGARPGYRPRPEAPLIPFGGGIDSIVTVERIREPARDPSLFIVGSGGRNFASIDDAAATAGLPVVRATRRLDPAILRPQPEWLNGHVPVTGIISAIGVLAAVLGGHDAVVMSNEWSTSAGNTVFRGRTINHQYSKSAAFEDGFRGVLDGAFEPPPDYFSLLRSASALWIGREFSRLRPYLPVFRSCNRAFHIDPALRQLDWCAVCDKCCFVDLILAPFLPRTDLDAIFGGREPLDNPALAGSFATLLGLSDQTKPFECVGDVDECRAALVLAAARPDRRGQALTADLLARLQQAGAAPSTASAESLFEPQGPHHIPARYAAAGLG